MHYPLAGKPDIVFPSKKIAIFIHGCFWHQHGCNNSVYPKTNKKFWKEKLEKNIQRDEEIKVKLKKDKWIVKTVWECEIEKDIQKVINTLNTFL